MSYPMYIKYADYCQIINLIFFIFNLNKKYFLKNNSKTNQNEI